MEAALGEGARLRQRSQRARIANLVAGRRQHGQRGRSEARLFLEWGFGGGSKEEGRKKWEEDTKCTGEQPRRPAACPGGRGSPACASYPRAPRKCAAPLTGHRRSQGLGAQSWKVVFR